MRNSPTITHRLLVFFLLVNTVFISVAEAITINLSKKLQLLKTETLCDLTHF